MPPVTATQQQKNYSWYADPANRAATLARGKVWYAANRTKKKAYDAARAVTLAVENRGRATAWNLAHPEETRQRQADFRSKNPGYGRPYQIKRKTRRQLATPLWNDKSLMCDIYKYAKIMRDSGIDCHVDHDIPLQGELVSGLHVHTNLTVLLAQDNLKKGRKFDPEVSQCY